MTKRIDEDLVLVEMEPDGECEMCGMVKELRPYGPGGSLICFDCGTKDEGTAERHFRRLQKGESDG